MQIPTLLDLGVSRKEKLLSNNVRVVLYEKIKAPVIIKIIFQSGSLHDPVGKEGLAHFVEHMILAGTRKFPQKDQLSRYIEKYGGGMHASTNNETLSIDLYISEAENIDILTDFLGDILSHSLFNEKIIESERGSILQEMVDLYSTAPQKAARYYLPLVYQGTPLEKRVIGSKESVSSFTQKDLLDYYKNYIVSERCTIVAAGGISIDRLTDSLERNTSFWSSEKMSVEVPKNLPINRIRNLEIYYDENTSNISFLFGFRTVSISHDDSVVLEMISDIVGGERSSLLLTELRYKKGIAYSPHTWVHAKVNSGVFTVIASTSTSNLSDVIGTVAGIFRDIKKNGINEEFITSMKQYKTNSLRTSLETAASWVKANHYYELVPSTRGKTELDFMAKYNAVTNEDIIRVANKYFREDAWYMTMSGKITEKDIPKIEL